MCYCPSQILPINVNSIPSEFIFPDGHPTKGVLYIVNPAQSNVYFRADEYELDIFREQLDELMILLTSLGAKSVTFRDARQHTNEQDCSSSSEINVSGNYDGYSGAGKYLGFAHNNAYEKLCNEYFREAIFEIGPNGPCEPKGLVWYSQQKDWKNLVQLRLSGKIIKDHKRISISKETSISNEEKKSIEAEFNVLIASIKGNVNTESNHLFKNNIDICWEYSVEFYPMKVYDNSTFAPSNCIFNKLESHPDQEYINQLKECLADGEIGIRERRLLDKIRVKLGISEERAYELEASLSKPKLTDDEKEYLDEYKAVAIDGVVTEKRRRLLDELRKMLDIPDERAREIEKLAL